MPPGCTEAVTPASVAGSDGSIYILMTKKPQKDSSGSDEGFIGCKEKVAKPLWKKFAIAKDLRGRIDFLFVNTSNLH